MSQAAKEAKARYRERNREKIRAWNRAYAERKRRAEGQSIRGSEEWLAKRRVDHYPTGERHGNWKGTEASYTAVHHWIKRWGVRTGSCSECGERPKPKTSHRKHGTEWANVSGEYRRDVTDWIELCPSCHHRRDRAKRARG